MRALSWQPAEVVVPQAEGKPALRLEARRISGARAAAVVAPPHPLYGGTFDNPVVLNIADGLLRAGVGPLTFNWRGTERSHGEKTDSLAAAIEDYAAALGVAARAAAGDPATAERAAGGPPLIAAGYSFGAGSALLTARDTKGLAGVILLAPPLGLLRADDLCAVEAPVLLVVGDEDEYAPITELKEVCAARADLSLVVLAGVDHFFHYGGLTEISAAVSEHAERWLAAR